MCPSSINVRSSPTEGFTQNTAILPDKERLHALILSPCNGNNYPAEPEPELEGERQRLPTFRSSFGEWASYLLTFCRNCICGQWTVSVVSGDYQTNWPRSFHLKRMLITLQMVTTLPLIMTPTNVKFTFYKNIPFCVFTFSHYSDFTYKLMSAIGSDNPSRRQFSVRQSTYPRSLSDQTIW